MWSISCSVRVKKCQYHGSKIDVHPCSEKERDIASSCPRNRSPSHQVPPVMRHMETYGDILMSFLIISAKQEKLILEVSDHLKMITLWFAISNVARKSFKICLGRSNDSNVTFEFWSRMHELCFFCRDHFCCSSAWFTGFCRKVSIIDFVAKVDGFRFDLASSLTRGSDSTMNDSTMT